MMHQFWRLTMKTNPEADYAWAFELMCNYYMSLMEGDTHLVEDAFTLMQQHGIINENNELIEDEEE